MEGKRKVFERKSNESTLIGISITEQATNRQYLSRAIISKGSANLAKFKDELSRECEMWGSYSTLKIGLTQREFDNWVSK